MAVLITDYALDLCLGAIRSSAVRIDVCDSQPITRVEALANSLANATVGPSDFVISDGDIDGRKLTLLAQSGITATGSGDADHLAVSSATELLAVCTITSQPVTTGNKIDLSAVDIVELGDAQPEA
ncbi:MAG: hypothetical protein AAGF99_00470 [Bacteroidota bacterium]